MPPWATLIGSFIVPALIAFSPDPYAATVTGWLIALVWWFGGRHREHQARREALGRRLDAIEAYALELLGEDDEPLPAPAQPAHEVNDRP